MSKNENQKRGKERTPVILAGVRMMQSRNLTKVLGKICPFCGQAGSVLYATNIRIVYECSNRHQYETKKWRRDRTEKNEKKGREQ
jgi:hypothetical protein